MTIAGDPPMGAVLDGGVRFGVPDATARASAAGDGTRAELPFTLGASPDGASLDGAARALAAFVLVLSRDRGEDAVALRVHAAGGDVPISIDLAGNPSARALVARVHHAFTAALGEDGDRALSASPLVVQAGGDTGPVADAAIRIDRDDPVSGALSVDSTRVASATAARFLGHLRVAADALAAMPGRGVLDLPLLTAEEHDERRRWNATEADLPHGVCLHQAFEAHADARPASTAILYGDEAIAYGELEARANRLAHHLRRHGVGPESRVGICVERGPRVLEAILGVLKAGGAYVPLDPAYPADRLAHMLEAGAVRVLVTEAELAARLPRAAATVLLDGDGAAAIAAESGARPEATATAENLAYVIFTSGSTGQPKGIALRHRGVMNNLADLNLHHGVGPADRVLLLSSLSFDMSVYETLGILAAGGAVVVPRPDELRDPAAWAALCRRHRVTLWNSAPALLGMLADHAEAHAAEAPAGLRLAFLGGDWVPVPLAGRVRAWAPALRDFIVMGGATEASIHSIIFPVREVDAAWRSIPYGVPMANQRAYVLDRHHRPLPVGVAGELFLAGIGLARGYAGRAGFTAERFVPDPHGRAGARMYRTGDLARFGGDGTIELLGRIDHQLKVRGLRIEPGEIETALRRHPAIARAVVTARADGGESRLVAYLVRADGAEPPAPRELRALLRESLPDYMVPAAYVVLDRLPLSPNGKVDRKQLPAPADDLRAPYVAPRTPAEAALAEIWAEVLGVDEVGAHDDFFALGGHSLAAARVAARVRGRLGVQLALGDVFHVPTLAELAATFGADDGARAAPIPRAAGGGPYPLAPAQRRLWLWEQMNPGQAAYNVPVALRLRGPVDEARLERSLDALVRRHESLRTVFELRDGEPVQRPLPDAPFALAVDTLQAGGDADAALRRRLAAEAGRPFDLGADRPFRALLLRTGEEHVLLLTAHHVVTDGWSTQVLLRELAALYDAFGRGEALPLPALPLRYADYAVWHRERLAAVESEQLAWWREHLAGAPALLEIPTDRPRPAVQGHRGAQHPVRLSADLVGRARALGREEGATLHMVLLAALDVVLARHARAERVVVGSAAAGRTHPDTEALVGFFINTVPIHADLSGDPGFRAFLRQVRASTLAAYDRQDVPFDRLVEALAPGRSRSHAPLVQVALAFQEAPARGFRLGDATAEAEWVDLGTAQFDLTFLLDEDEHGVSGVLEYATDLFEAATAERIAGHLRVLLEAAVAAPDRRLSALPLVEAEEAARVLGAWSGAGERFPVHGGLHQRFEARAAAHPDAPAATFEGESLSYGELNARANRLARRLRALGVAAESRVGLCTERSLDLVVGVLAILKAGGAYVPLDPAYPAERLAYMAGDSGIRVLLAQAALRERISIDGVEIVSIDHVAADESGDDLGVAIDPANLAYVIYTSGSTGRPKGVGVTHGNVLRLFESTDASFGFGAQDVWTLFHSYAFDFSVWEIWGALLYGGRLVVVPWAVSRDPAAFRELLRRERVTVLNQTPSAFRALAAADERAAEPLERLRTVVFGGEALQYESLRGWLDRYGPKRPRLVNMYGITETTVHVTWHTVTGAELRNASAGSGVGVPIPDLRAYVLDAAGNPSPVGIPGELLVGGDGLARGYLGRPALTAQRFIPDPFGTEPGARLYRSGDLAKRRADGTLEYLGRIDQQVKIRGFRIELGEIESLLLAHSRVAAAAVVVRGEGEGASLAAYFVAEGEAPSHAELRDALAAHLPEYMVPSAFVALDRIPLTANGKLDRAALPAPLAAGDAPGAAEAAPRTPVEEVLAGIWAEVLRRDRVGVRDDFFALGGHSLLATRVVTRIAEVFGVAPTVGVLFEAPTVARLAARVEEMRREGLPQLPPVVPVARGAEAPASFAQERLWFLHRLRPESAFYNVPVVWRMAGALDAAALERSLGEIVRRHESLRTTFREAGGAPVQVIAPFGGFALPVEDLSALADDARAAAMDRRVAEEAARPFDLAAGPLFRAALLRLGADEHVLLLTLHHVVSDDWSTGVLFRELQATYAAFHAGAEPALAPLPVQYADYAAWQREQLRGSVLDAQLAYWTERLAGAPARLELPADRPRPAVQSFRGAREAFELPAALADGLRALGRGEGATLYMVMLAAFQLLLAKYAGVDDVVVGSPIAGRTRREVEELIGFFVNTLALRADLSGDPPFRALLRRVREATLGAWEHQELPFVRLVEALQPERSLSHAPLFQVMLVQEDADPAAAGLPGLAMRRLAADSGTSKFDLTLAFGAHWGGIGGSVEYSTDLFDRATIQRMIRHLSRVLEQATSTPDAPLSALELTDGAERGLVLDEWNRTAADFPADRCIHELFEAQAARTPDALAVVFEGDSLTYRELDARANRLAHRLIGLGVGPEVRVGLCLERSLEMVISILAVLKAGGGYVPLDPSYPADRLAFMLADSAVSVLLTQERLRAAIPVADGVRVVSVDGDWEQSTADSAAEIAPRAVPTNLAYVIYTSGSTGRPKGVMNAHGGVVNRLGWMQAEYGIGAGDVVLQKTPFGFDVSVWEFFWPLQQGATLVMARPDGHRDPAYLQEVIEQRGVTTIHFVPSMLQQFVESADPARCTSLKRVICSGEALPPALVERFHARFPSTVELHNLYGPTEAAVDVSYWSCEREGPADVVPIGRPVWNTQLYVLDSALRAMPIGVPGELYIGGVQVARGYLGRPALTAERFIPDPYAATAGARLYRTGDKARWRADGAIEYLGRLDGQVKVRGFRIELGEIESVLRRHAGVADCAVIAREDAPGETRLVAYIVGDADADALRGHLRKTLPDYMVPAAFVALDALPLSPNGKLDRKALPAPDATSTAESYVAPRTPTEEVLAAIWADVLRAERVGVNEGFFDLGGHSLLATRVASRVREALGVELPVRALFEGPTVAELAERVDALQRADAPAPRPAPVERGDAPPLSFAQERLWFLDRLRPGSAFYNVPVAVRLAGALDAAALERALGEIVRRHEPLRTTFAERDGAPVQVIAPFGGFALPMADVAEAELERVMAMEAERPFDLAAGPLFRATLLRLGADDHVLLISLHHSVSDEWSLGVLFRELQAFYAAFRDGAEPSLPPLALQYADFAAGQRERLSGEVLEGQLAYWRRRLAGAPALLELPTDHPRPAVQSFRGAREAFALPADLAARLAALGRREGVTPYMLLLAAFQVLLSKHGAGEDVVVGSPIAGRTHAEVEALIGFFTNTLVMRADLSGDPGFREVLRRVREATLGAFEHQDVPFERLVEELHPERGLSHSPLFQAMFVHDDGGEPDAALPGVTLTRLDLQSATSKFDLTLSTASHAGGIAGSLEYATDLFERETIVRMLGHLRRVLEQVADDADRPLSALDLVDADERRMVLGDWNRTSAAFPADRCIHDLFEAQAARTPDAVAVVFDGDSLTYRELNARADQLAHRLIGLGVGPEVRVGLCLERSLEMVISILAVLKAGGGYVPLDPSYPADRLAFMLADSAVSVLLTQERLRAAIPVGDSVRVLTVDGDWDRSAASGVDEIVSRSVPANLAYVIYTSGSTGRPKGVMNAHGGVVNRLSWMQAEYGIGAGDVVLQKTPFGFDVSVWEFFWPLQQGATLVMARPDGHRDPAYLHEVIERQGVTTLHFVPSMLQQFVETADPERCASLKRVICSGEALPPALVERFHARFPSTVELHNLYGPTEAAVDVSYWSCEREGPVDVVPIGRPVWNTQLYVLDASLRAMPIGVPGELYIGGVQVARGYLGRPALTAERFIPDPYAATAGARLYRTGDKARWRADGAIEYLGRLDGQVKVRGFRIELGEIESVLRRHAGVADCAVIAREDEPGETRLVAYIVGDADADALRGHLRKTLPDYMVPAAFVALDALPLSPNGKLDRKALPAPDATSTAESYVAPRTPTEEVLAAIWADVLRAERVGVNEGFFDLGGHSLLATRVASRVREALGVELPVRALFEGPTVAGLAARVDALRREGLAVLPPVSRVERTGAMPLSFAQERLWFLDRMEPESPFYNIPAALRLRGALSVPALERALGEIVRRHESLRTTFADRDGAPVQVIAPFGGFALPVEDIAALPAAAREAEAMRRAADEASRPFDLAAGPVFRATLLRLADDEHVLLLCMHHVVSDGWSLGVLFRELRALYGAYRDGMDAALPDPAVQYADFAAWQREHLRGDALERHLAWWRERLAGAPALLELPTDHPRPAEQRYRGARVPAEVPTALLDRLHALARAEGATPYMVLLAAFQVLLSKYSGGRDVVVGSPIAGRTRAEVEGVIGFFVNTLVLRTDLSGDPGFREVLRRVRQATLGAYEHQEVPFERLVEELQPERSLSHSPLFQVMFILQNLDDQAGGLPGLLSEPVDVERGSTKFDLTLAFAPGADGLRGEIEYSTDLFERETIERMRGHLLRVLEQVAGDADVRLSALDLVDAGERRRVLEEWNRTGADFPARCIHQLFEAQAARTPDAVAVTFGAESLTFAQLDARANRLANHLARLGVGPEVRVGLCLERGLEPLAAILGVMKAGGAYVPVDPAHPAGRNGYVLADSAVTVLVTQAKLRDALPVAQAVRVVTVDGDAAAIAAESIESPVSEVTAENLAYVIYTSGSTGRPKGVAMHHRGVANYIDWGIRAYGADSGAGAPVFSSLAVDLTITNLLPLFAGHPIRFLPEEAPVEALADALREKPGFGLIKITPVHLALLNPLLSAADARGAARTLVVGADFLNAEPTVFWQDHAPGVRLMNEYGPTETVVGCSAYVLPAGQHRAGPVPVGGPIQNMRFYVLDPHLQPVPVGLPGELFIGGVGVARGYLGRPGLTAERFVPEPWGRLGARMYRTGDRARWLPGGDLMILGRTDNQVKVRGFRVELGEVEAVLRRVDEVRECLVVVREDRPGDRRLVAYVVGDADPAALRDHLRRSVPEYMVPSAFVSLPQLPQTATGKLDPKTLPAPEYAAGAAGRAPRNALERTVAEVWRDVLAVSEVGANDNFFDLGGTSLLLYRVYSRLREIRVDLRVVDLFRFTTVEALAGHLGEAQAAPQAGFLSKSRSRAEERRAALAGGR